MLKNIPDCICPELLKVLHEMGHGDRLIIGDANFPATSSSACGNGVNIRCDGNDAKEMLDAILQLFPLDDFVEEPVLLMNKTPKHADMDVKIWGEFKNIVRKYEPSAGVGMVDRFEFYDIAKKAYAIVSTTEKSPYACIVLQKGCL